MNQLDVTWTPTSKRLPYDITMEVSVGAAGPFEFTIAGDDNEEIGEPRYDIYGVVRLRIAENWTIDLAEWDALSTDAREHDHIVLLAVNQVLDQFETVQRRVLQTGTVIIGKPMLGARVLDDLSQFWQAIEVYRNEKVGA